MSDTTIAIGFDVEPPLTVRILSLLDRLCCRCRDEESAGCTLGRIFQSLLHNTAVAKASHHHIHSAGGPMEFHMICDGGGVC